MRLGVFDSGLGGLTVVKEIQRTSPQVDIIYLGDTARVPYGIRSAETIKLYTQEGCQFLHKMKVDAIVLACNSMSAYWPGGDFKKLPVFSVIEPAAKKACQSSKTKTVGIIATMATVESGAYQKALHKIDSEITLTSQPAPLLVPLIEEGLLSGEIVEKILLMYLAPLSKEGIDTLILGCTHYPLMLGAIKKVIDGSGMGVIDSGAEVAREIKTWLMEDKKFKAKTNPGSLSVYVTDIPRRFESLAERFLGRKLSILEKIKLP